MKRVALTCSARTLAWILALSPALYGQAPIPSALTTAGTTKIDEQGRTWAYIVLNPADPALLEHRTLAVFVKPGAPEQDGSFTRLAVLRPAPDAATIRPLLERADRLNGPGGPRTRAALDRATAQVWAEARWQDQLLTAPDTPRPQPPFTGQPPLAERIAGLIQRARTDTATAQSLQLLAFSYPAVKQSLGLAWAGVLPVANGQTATVEIRDWAAASQTSLAVLGRVTLTAAEPDPLLPPGAPVQVPEFNAKGDLNIKLRWATPPELARQGLLVSGYNVWRAPVRKANEAGILAGMSPDLLLAYLADGTLTKVNGDSAVLPPKSFTEGDPSRATDVSNFTPLTEPPAALPAGDPDTFFLADDNERYTVGAPDRTAFQDGEEFYYFVTACDLLGRDGISSPGGLAMARRLLPPPAPKGLRVANHHTPGSDRQAFELFWDEIPADTFLDGTPVPSAPGTSSTIVYEVLKGTDLSFLHDPEKRNSGLLPPISFAGVGHEIPYPASGIIDDSLPPTDDNYRSTFFFAVRAIKKVTTAHGSSYELPGPYSPPVMASLHNRHGPAAPQAAVALNYARALVQAGPLKVASPPQPLPFGAYGYQLLCERLDSSVEWAEFFIPAGRTMHSLGRVYFSAGRDAVQLDLQLPYKITTLFCQTGGYIGTVSRPAFIDLDDKQSEPMAAGKLHLFPFRAAELSPATFDPSHPLAFELSTETFARTLGTPQLLNANDAYFFAETASDAGTEVLIQVDQGGGQWKFLGVDFVASGSPRRIRFLDPLRAPPQNQQRPLRKWDMRPPATLSQGHRPMLDEVIVPVRVPADGTAFSPVLIFGTLTAPAREYRIYRQIADGVPSLIKQGTGDPAGNNASFAMSDALQLPAAVAKSYYLQVLDEDGNPSPMTLIYHDPGYGAPPAPRLSEIRTGGTADNPTMILEWFCEPEGIDRFELAIANAFNLSLPAALFPSPNFLQGASQLATVVVNRPNAPPIQLSLTYESVRQTPKVGGTQFAEDTAPFSRNGPRFRAELPVRAGNHYTVTVRALSDRNLAGPFSAAREYTWNPIPDFNDPAIPWPARPLPEVADFPAPNLAPEQRITALQIPYANGSSDLIRGGPFGASVVQNDEVMVAVRLGRQVLGGSKDTILTHSRGAVFTAQRYSSSAPSVITDLRSLLYSRSLGSTAGSATALPAVLYREQVANDLFPHVSGDVMQVTPLIREVLQEQLSETSHLLLDPYLALRLIQNHGNIEAPEAEILLIDPQPVVTGASYRYTLLRFDPITLEPVQTIPCGIVTIQ